MTIPCAVVLAVPKRVVSTRFLSACVAGLTGNDI